MSKKELVILLGITCFVVMVWIISDILHSKARVEVSPSLQQALEPINPEFDQEILQRISNISKKSSNKPTPTPSPVTEESSPSGEF